MLHSSLPESIADEVKVRILREYEKAYIEVSKCFDFESDLYKDIATEIFIAILHPSVSKIQCVEYTCHPNPMDGFKMRYSDLVYDAIRKLKNIRVLRISDAIYFNKRHELGGCYDDSITETLEEFCSGMSSNREIRTLCSQCKNLKILDIGNSSDVYEESVCHILNMKNLEELDVHYTSIYRKGFEKLLNGLASTKHSNGKLASECLKKLICEKLSHEQVVLVSCKFCNLVNLTLYAEGDLIPLKSLRSLKYFHVSVKCFKYLKELLCYIGSQLVCFKMKDIPDTDLHHVAETCVSLNCLHLENSPSIENISTKSKIFSVPQFPKVLNLELSFSDDSCKIIKGIMSQFKNLRRLFLSECANDDVFNFVLQRKCMNHLEIAFFQRYYNEHITLQFTEKYAVITAFDNSVSHYSVPI